MGGGTMAKQITEYELLISCPSDVKEELRIINETVETFNQLFGTINNAKIVTKHWSKDSYPQSGGKPQKLLNEQFVLGCDAAVAVFWTRFGTPTDEYGSGTEEEIEELIKSGKQVFLYFSDCVVSPSQVDNEQYEKVKAFRSKYKDRGLFGIYSSIEIFKKDFLNHLTLYFVNLLQNSKEKQVTYRSNISIKGVSEGKVFDYVVPFRTSFSKNRYLENLEEKAISFIAQINSIILPIEIPTSETEKIIEDNGEEEFPDKSIGELNQLTKASLIKLSETFSGLRDMYSLEPIKIDKTWKEKIDKFARDNDISLTDTFYDLGGLTKQRSTINLVFGSSISYNGTDEEKNKHKLITELKDILDQYDMSFKYFLEIDSKFFINLALCNFGTDFDEDIDVKLFFEKGYICCPENLPFPEYQSLDMGIETFAYIYKSNKNVIIDDYPDYASKPYIPRPLSLMPKTYEEELKERIERFNDEKELIFCYDIYLDEDYDIFCYNQRYLKQNTNSFLPSYLVFNKKPDLIKYEIRAKRFPDIITGSLIIKEIIDS
jgi:hypothetical protein